MNIFESLFATKETNFNIDMSEKTNCPTANNNYIEHYHNHHHHYGWVAVCVFLAFVVVPQIPSCHWNTTSKLESQVRQWAKENPSDLRNRWAWCYLDSAENWSTDQKLREDVRLKSTQVLSADEREKLAPLDKQIATEIPKQKTPLKETYTEVGNGLKTAEWHPPPAEPPPTPPKPEPPQRRRLFRGVQSP